MKQTQDQYVKDGGCKCPGCGSTDIVGDQVTIERGQAFQECSCSECDGTWTDVYTLQCYRDWEDGE